MRLSDLLRREAITLEITDLDKWRVIENLTNLLVSSGRLAAQKRNAVLDALLLRERSMSTGMENGIAIPHCSMEDVEETLVALGVAKGGIDFESIDGKPTHLILLLVTPKNKTKVHIRTLAEIAKLLNDARFRDALVAAADAETALDLVRRREAEER
jgi:mannitol/fructose-specific phosphotransferase system IIA component (Ntr-type)